MYQTIQAKLSTVKEAQDISIKTPEAILEQCQDMTQLAQESFQILTLNAHNKLIDRHLITLGIVNACLVHPREVLKACILDSASAFIAVHNHPSGDPTPSAEDIRITRTLIEASKIIDIQFLDHVIVSQRKSISKFCSFKEENICQF